jgi:hypothetical protein
MVPPRRILAGWLSATILLLTVREAACQTAQVGAVPGARAAPRLVIDHVGYRAARWEHEAVVEPEHDEPNRGGIVSAYVRNVSDAPVRLRFWRLNGRDESLYRVDRLAVWDRTCRTTLPPGATTVVEINGRTADFGPGGEFRFAWVDDSWEEVGGVETRLEEDPVQVSFIRLHPDRATLDADPVGGTRRREGDGLRRGRAAADLRASTGLRRPVSHRHLGCRRAAARPAPPHAHRHRRGARPQHRCVFRA